MKKINFQEVQKKLQKNNLIWLGTIVNTHALKGEIKIITNSDNIDYFFKKNGIIYIKNNDSFKDFKIISVRKHKNFILLFLENINTIEEANKLKNKEIYINHEELEKDDFYFKDVIGARVIDQNKKEIGIVKSYYDQKSYYSFEIINKENLIFNIPILDEFIINFDKDKKILYVKLPEGFY
ncbi:MAG: ribosome maturation factor RimM [Candidatus Hepatoplasma vulgare]|nr:MAG: ribosome maturation factor RimM [Candidatus Hepatoplasma sp.]